MLESTCKSVRDQGWRPQLHQGSDYDNSHCLHMLISMHGWRKAFSSVGARDLLAYAQGVHRCELSVMEISFDQTLPRHNIKKVSSSPWGSGEYLLYQWGSYQNYNNTNPSYWTCMCSADFTFLYQWLWKRWGRRGSLESTTFKCEGERNTICYIMNRCLVIFLRGEKVNVVQYWRNIIES